MKVLLELKKEPKKNDLLIFDGEGFIPISKSTLFSDLICDLEKTKKELAETKKYIDDLKVSVNDKLKEYHNVLQLLSKGGK